MYNGWKNYETWNVALWIGNDEGLYNLAKEYSYRGYKSFVASLAEMAPDGTRDTPKPSICYQTPDGVAWNDSGLDIDALDEMIKEL